MKNGFSFQRIVLIVFAITALASQVVAQGVGPAEPSPLPQAPVAARVGSDATDSGLHGDVKTVFLETEDLRRGTPVPGRMRTSMSYYNEGGNLTKVEDYDYKGNLGGITVYGYIDGARVAKNKSFERDPLRIVVASPPGVGQQKSDSRYSVKYTFRYDDQKRLIEKNWIMTNGETASRTVYKYSPNQRETLSYSRGDALNRRAVTVLDDKGNEVEQTTFRPDGSIWDKYSYASEFDAKGNWTKRVTSKWVTKDGKSSFVPQYAEYRTIVYYEK